MASLSGGVPYAKRPVPTPGTTLAGWATHLSAWLAVEFGNIARRIAPASTRLATSNTDVLMTDGMIRCDATAGPLSVTWPTPLPKTEDWVVTILKSDASGNAITIVGTVSGVVSPTLTAQYKAMTIWSTGDVLYKIAAT
jgi:hypothetical protein